MRYHLSDGQNSIDLGECDSDEDAGRAAMVAMGEGPDCEWDDWYIVDETGRRC